MRLIQRFEVSLKGFIVKNGKALFVREADTGYWELPGGRIDVGEEWLPHADVLAREIREELGGDFRVRFGSEVVTWTRQRPTDRAFLFILARLGRYEGGEPALSAEHSECRWLGPDAAQNLEFPPDCGYPEGIEALWRLVSDRPEAGVR
jgi:8-oxo-dGTP pyrophosphatase MutT (NUDIX family)